MAVIYIPFLQDIFRTQALTLSELLICIALSSIVFWAVEFEKWFKRKKLT
jgi:Ca2+-transporting ATPase